MGLLWRNVGVMCRNIKILRAPYAVGVTDDDVHAAALQYVRTVGGVRLPSPHNAEAFNQAVDTISAATRDLLAFLEASPEGPGGLAKAPIDRPPEAPLAAGGRRERILRSSHGGGVRDQHGIGGR